MATKHRQALIDCYQAVVEIGEHEGTPESVASDCDNIADALMRIFHEVDPGAYQECMGWNVDQSLPPGVTVERVIT